jgi:hypothetical protein
MADYEDPTLKDPDGDDVGDTKYRWDEQFQRHIIALVLCDRQFMLQSLDLIKSSYFTHKAHQKACGFAQEHFKKYRLLPKKDFILQEIKLALKDDKHLDYYLGEINGVFEYFQPGLDSRDYLQDKISYFAKIQAVRTAFHNSLKEIDKNPESEETWVKVYDLMRDAMTVHQNFEVGLDYFQSLQDRYAEDREDEDEKEIFITGLESIDKEIGGGGYNRGEIISIVAGSGVGKSVMLACIAGSNLLRGKKGVYISLELAEDKIADRMDAILTGFPIQNLYGHKDAVLSKLMSLNGVDYDTKIPFIIKQFPAGTASVNTVRAYISQLRFHGFDPDFIIIDYVGEMADMPGLETYESREKTVRDLRGMAMEENVFIATAMQPNRSSKEANKHQSGRIDDEHLADSFGQIRPLDGCFSIMQNDAEKLLGVGRMYVMKQRDGKSRYMLWLQFDQQNLRITEIAHSTYMAKLNAHKEKVADGVSIDAVDHIVKPIEPPPSKDDDEDLPAID